MYDPERMRAAFNAAEKPGLPIWAGFSARQSKNGDLFSFLPEPDLPLIELLTILSDFNPDASGFMHTQSDAIESSLKAQDWLGVVPREPLCWFGVHDVPRVAHAKLRPARFQPPH